eukprot:6754823-Alexandrium_andersonii.AAC.1
MIFTVCVDLFGVVRWSGALRMRPMTGSSTKTKQTTGWKQLSNNFGVRPTVWPRGWTAQRPEQSRPGLAS